MSLLKNRKKLTADICDEYYESTQVIKTQMLSFGGISHCHGEIVTFLLDEDNRTLKAQLQSPGNGKVAVIDVTGEKCAIIGDRLIGFAIENNWAGIILNGYIRDSVALKEMPIGIWALGTYPLRSLKQSDGQLNKLISFGGVNFNSGNYLYADEDGIVILDKWINLPE